MSNLIFSLNATMPIFLTMILGLFFRKVGILDESFTSKMNKFVFKIALPVLLFQDLSDSDFSAVWDIKFVLFCFFATLLSILAVWGLSHLLKERSARGEFIQAAYRSSAAILGIAFIQNIYGNSGMEMCIRDSVHLPVKKSTRTVTFSSTTTIFRPNMKRPVRRYSRQRHRATLPGERTAINLS